MKKHAILVGVERYADTQITPLAFARADVTSLADALRGVCGFDSVRVLAAEAGPDAPELPNILHALQEASRELTADDLFLFVFAGHGVEVDGQSYLLTPRVTHEFPDMGSLSLTKLQGIFSRLPARRRVLILDACRNSPQAARGDEDNPMGVALSRDIVATASAGADTGTTTVLLSACGSGQRAYEWPQQGHGVFTHFLLRGMTGAAWNGARLELPRLAAYAREQVLRWSRAGLGDRVLQEPWYQQFGDPAPIVLAERATRSADAAAGTVASAEQGDEPSPPAAPPQLHVSSDPAGARVELDGREVGPTPVSVDVGPGTHRVRVTKQGHGEWQRDVTLSPGRDHEIQVLLPAQRKGPHDRGRHRRKHPRPDEVPAEADLHPERKKRRRVRLTWTFVGVALLLAVVVGPKIWLDTQEEFAARQQQKAADALGVPVEQVIDIGQGQQMRFRLVPAGKFQMGSPEDEKGRDSDEGQQWVTIPRAFYLCDTEVTRAQWLAVMGKPIAGWDDSLVDKLDEAEKLSVPVTHVTPEEARAFCLRLSERTGRTFRLPDEAEWEYACRATTTGAFHFVQGFFKGKPKAYTWHGTNRKGIQPVGGKAPNGWGLYDMHGNVREICRNRYWPRYSSRPASEPSSQGEYFAAVVRGGSRFDDLRELRSAARRPFVGDSPDGRRTGFRVLMELPASK